MTRRKRGGVSLAALIASMTGVVLLLATMILGAGASTGTTITAGNGTTTAGGSTTTSVIITIAAADAQMNAADVTLTYDPAVATLSGWTASAGWQDFGSSSVPGSLHLILLRLPANVPCGASCPLVSLTWLGVADGTTAINRSASTLAQAGQPITHAYVAGTLQVGTVANTNTPTNTATATNTTTGPTNTPTLTPTATTSIPTATSTGTATATPSGTTTPTATPTSTPVLGFHRVLPEVARDGIAP